MRMFWEFFTFEVRLRLQEYLDVYLFPRLVRVLFPERRVGEFRSRGRCQRQGPAQRPLRQHLYDIGVSLFGIIIIAAIFGTSILRDFQRDTYQMLFTKPISKFAYLGGRWAGSLLATVFVFSGCLLGEFVGTFAPWADHARIGPNHLSWYLQPFFSITVVQIFFLGSLFFTVAALSRKIFIVYLQGAGAVHDLPDRDHDRSARHDRWSTSGRASSIPSVSYIWMTSPATGQWSSAIRSY